jgi:iron complex outermembrane receptor protein
LFKFKPEYSSSYEVGVKNDFLDSRLRLNIALFYTIVNNAQIPILVLPDGVTITKNAGDLRSKGAEAEIAITPVKNLEINYNFGYTSARYTSAAVLKLNPDSSEVNLKNKRQIYTPKTTSALAIQYGCGIGSKQNLKLVIRGEWINLGSQYFDLANTIKQSSYGIFNAKFGVAAKNFEVMLWARNFGDKRYVSYAYDFGAIHLGDPRTYGVTLTGKF